MWVVGPGREPTALEGMCGEWYGSWFQKDFPVYSAPSRYLDSCDLLSY